MPAAWGFSLGVLARHAGVDAPERVDDFDREVAAVGQRDAGVERTSARRRHRRRGPGPRRASAQRMSSLACEGCIEAITPSSAKRRTSSLRTTCACSIRSRGSRALGDGSAAPRRRRRAPGALPLSPIAWVQTCQPFRRALGRRRFEHLGIDQAQAGVGRDRRDRAGTRGAAEPIAPSMKSLIARSSNRLVAGRFFGMPAHEGDLAASGG